MKNKKVYIALGVICFLLTTSIIIQIKTINNTIKIADPTFEENELRDEVLIWKEKYDNCYKALEVAEKELESQRKNATQNDTESKEKEELIKQGNNYLGLTDVTGKGIILTLRDSQTVNKDTLSANDDISNYLIHEIDIINVINELKNAGAEAISINNERIIFTSSIMCAGNVVKVNGQKVAAPFEIKAIGIPESLEETLKRPGGICDVLESYKITTEIKKQSNLTIPKYAGVLSYKYLKEVK